MTLLPLIGEEPELTKESPDDIRMWSVTTLISALDRPALLPWAVNRTAEAAVDSDTWRYLLENEGRDAALRWLKNARFRTGKNQRSATELGTAVHRALEHKILHGRFRDEDKNDLELKPFLRQLNDFLRQFRPKFLGSEITLYAPSFNYAGTCDGFLELDGVKYIFDLKTSREPYDSKGQPKKPYPEAALQLSAYRYSELAAVWRARQAEVFRRRYYLLSDTERALAVPVPEVDHGLVLMVTPDFYSVHPVDCGPDVFEAFLAVVDSARFVFDIGQNVIGNALITPTALRDSTDPFAGLPS